MRRSSVGCRVATEEWTSGIEGVVAFVFMSRTDEYPSLELFRMFDESRSLRAVVSSTEPRPWERRSPDRLRSAHTSAIRNCPWAFRRANARESPHIACGGTVDIAVSAWKPVTRPRQTLAWLR